MQQISLTAGHVLTALAMIVAIPAAASPFASVELITTDAYDDFYTYNDEVFQTSFAATGGGFAVGSTSPSFGGSTMATASSTKYLHFAEASLYQLFSLPAFITSSRVTLDFKGQVFALGNAAAYISYIIQKNPGSGGPIVGSGFALSTPLVGLGGKSGSVSLTARRSFTLLGGESFLVETHAIAETGYKDGAGGYFTYSEGAGYATAFMDPVVSFSAAVPEPATWAMLIAGFGLVGAAARRRRVVAAAC